MKRKDAETDVEWKKQAKTERAIRSKDSHTFRTVEQFY